MPKQEKNIPALRFPEFKGEWVKHTFESLYRCVPTNSFSRNDLQEEPSEISNIHYGDIHTAYNSKFRFSSERVPFVINDKLDKLRNYTRVKKGDLIFADASEDVDDIGKMIEVVELGNAQLVSGLHTIHATPKKANSMASGFSADLFKTTKVRQQIIKESQGAKILGLSAKRLAKTSLIIPGYKEQQKIAAFLSAIDDKIAQIQKKKGLLEGYKKGCMQKLFSQEIRFSDDKGDAFPNWEVKKLKNLTSVITKGTTPTSVGYNFTDKGVNFIKAESLDSTYKIIEDKIAYISLECHESLKRSQIFEGDLLFSIAGTLGRSAIAKKQYLPANINQAISVIRLKDITTAEYINHFLNSFLIRKKIKQILSVGAQPNLSLDQVGDFKIQYPCLDEQRKIADFLTAIDEKIALVSEELEKAKAFKKGLLQQMFV
ncbi:restriction endonuclease subunit S [Micavibrio aeruginosavorus]|uniref:Type I restriction modification DNA specificity domain protein n=1 Tax=Micavibrio aeruginosavorus (strain ARL-13) TaxID=856793 RepID=G2KRK7_MICAA|nr:restriction endonuclease subunit S [Micavibrio aeruginosavorus]AEP09569.1 type I restriction modification DNA specificity domain protein [Micavibrio aeruginosavorus ARL-13]